MPILVQGFSLTLSQLKQLVENNAEMKLPGRKNMVTTASVFIEEASRWLEMAILKLLILSLCWRKLVFAIRISS